MSNNEVIVIPANIEAVATKDRIVAIKSINHCVKCGWNPVAHADATGIDIRLVVQALDFAHHDRSTKYRTAKGKVVDPGRMFRKGYSLSTILAELAHCKPLCKVCHTVETAIENAVTA